MLWLAVYLPDFSLEVLSRGSAAEQPMIVTGGHGTRQWLLVCSPEAQARGLRPGMGLQAAYALAPELRVLRRNEDLESEALANLAAWAGQFTSLVSLQFGQGLLLEVEGSLELFGGLEQLWTKVKMGLARLGYSGCLALAPTPLGAWFMASCGLEQRVNSMQELGEQLASLPLKCLGLSRADGEALRGMGLCCLADLLRQPRDALVRRFGQQLMDRLDRAMGKLPDPQRSYRPPLRFEGRLALPAEVVDAEALGFPLRRLLLELSGYLVAISGSVQRFWLGFVHPGRVPTRVLLGLASPTRDLSHLLELVRQRLEKTELPAPVAQVELRAEEVISLMPHEQDLFSPMMRPDEHWQKLVDRLNARLGQRAVQGMGLWEDHRPERAWSYTRPGVSSQGKVSDDRPLWLLAKPRLLEVRDGQPCFGSVLQIQCGPERIESGWWDGDDVVRDYYVAQNRKGERLWIFHEQRAQSGWFLHGFFG